MPETLLPVPRFSIPLKAVTVNGRSLAVCLTPLANGDVFGGFAFYTPASGTWTNTGPTPPGFAAAAGPPTATLLTNSNVLMTGFTQVCRGCGPKPSSGALLFEFATNTKVTTGDMNVARVNDSAVRLPSGLVLVSGGVSQIFGQPIASAELYTP